MDETTVQIGYEDALLAAVDQWCIAGLPVCERVRQERFEIAQPPLVDIGKRTLTGRARHHHSPDGPSALPESETDDVFASKRPKQQVEEIAAAKGGGVDCQHVPIALHAEAAPGSGSEAKAALAFGVKTLRNWRSWRSI